MVIDIYVDIPIRFRFKLDFCDVEWIVKDDYIGSAFFDASASAFIAPFLQERLHKRYVNSCDDCCFYHLSFLYVLRRLQLVSERIKFFFWW